VREPVRVRIAPSPTGPIHIGNARTALFNYLYARHTGGKFVLRLEDTDIERSDPKWEQAIYDELGWLGLEWDEGPDVGGPYEPYRQTERLDRYVEYADRLLASGHAYRCFCTVEELEEERRLAHKRGEVYHYGGRCRELAESESEARKARGEPFVLRFRVNPDRLITVSDVVHGDVQFPGKDVGDFIIVRTNGMPVYNFAVVVDDITMGITHILRASEHLPNSAAQVLIYEALDRTPPTIAHVGLVLGSDRRKLSKRTGDAFLGEFREKGYLPEALFNFLALLGWRPEGEQELFTKSELIRAFSLDRLANHPAVFDLDKLNWMNGQYIRRLSSREFLDRCLPFLVKAGMVKLPLEKSARTRLEAIVALFQDEVSYLSQIPERIELFLSDRLPVFDDAAAAVLGGEHVPRVLAAFQTKVREANTLDRSAVRTMFTQLRHETGLGGRKVFMPVRIALTGKVHGPELYSLIPLLGSQRVKQRIRHVLRTL